MKRLAGKTALITGSARGIGKAFAQRYVHEGARVCISDINLEEAQETAREIGNSAVAVGMDVTKQESMDAGIERWISHRVGLGLVK